MPVAVTALLLCGCGPDRAQTCREGARSVFDAILAGDMGTAEGQRRVDIACKGVPAAERAAILDAEKTSAAGRAVYP